MIQMFLPISSSFILHTLFIIFFFLKLPKPSQFVKFSMHFPQQYFMQKRLLILAALIYIALTACNANLELSNIESGSLTIASDNVAREMRAQIYEYAFKSNFGSEPKAILAFQGFFSRSKSISQWHADADKITKSKLSVAFYHQGSEWNSIRLGFWASSRDDFLLGTLSENIDTSQKKNYQFNKPITFINERNPMMIVRTFLNGYKSETEGLVDLAISQEITSISNVRFRIDAGDMDLRKIYLSYIVFNPASANFTAYGGQVSKINFRGSAIYNFQQKLHETPYAIHGITSAKFSNAVNFRFNTQLAQEFYYRVDSSSLFDNYTILFLAIGVPTKDNCANCAEKYVNNGQCVAQCPVNQYSKIYSDGGRGCRSCPAEYGYQVDFARSMCSCQRNFVRSQNGFCIAGPPISPVAPTTVTPAASITTPTSSSNTNSSNIRAQTNSQQQQTITVATSNTSYSFKAGSSQSQNIIQTTQNQIISVADSQKLAAFGAVNGPSSTNFNTPSSFSTPTSFTTQPATNSDSFSTPKSFSTSSSFLAQSTPQPQVVTSFSTPSSFSTQSSASYSSTSIISVNTQVNQVSHPTYQETQQYQAPLYKDCSKQPYTIFNGIECACKVGYVMMNGACAPYQLIGGQDIWRPAEFINDLSAYHSKQPEPIFCKNPNEFYNGQLCQCKLGFERINGVCSEKKPTCQQNAYFQDGQCICISGYKILNSKCVKENACPENAFFNGVSCACNKGYYMANNICIYGSPCPPNSERIGSECACLSGYFRYQGLCSKCPSGKLQVDGECITLCGVNQIVSSEGKCQCRPGYGKFQGKCSICPAGFFEFNGFCAACPIGSQYVQQSKKCVCKNGYIYQNGFCREQCEQNEIYSATLNKCLCSPGLGRINGFCQVCPIQSIDPATEKCINFCKNTEVLQGNKCICKAGLGISNGECIDCQKQFGGFLLNGYCAICPVGLVRIDNQCRCPSGQKLKDGKCVEACLPGQILDEFGYCYECPIKEIAVNGKCQCREGYQKINGICSFKCDFVRIQGTDLCAKCALGTQYDPKIGACVCGQKFYKSPNGYCVPSVIVPIQCPKGKYYSPIDGCVACPFSCSQCESNLKCTVCSEQGYEPTGTFCLPKCGDKFIARGEECDDGNERSNDGCSSSCKIQNIGPVCGDGKISGTEQCDDKNSINSDGCSNCKVDPDYSCNGEPSICNTKIINKNKGMSLRTDPLFNMVNIFVLLKTDKPYYFDSEQEMRNFIKSKFYDESVLPGQIFCLQQPSNPTDYRCLLVYNSGIPNKKFDVDFSYNYKGQTGFLKVEINPTKNSFNTRSLA